MSRLFLEGRVEGSDGALTGREDAVDEAIGSRRKLGADNDLSVCLPDTILLRGLCSFFAMSYFICLSLSIDFASTRAQDMGSSR